MLKNLLFILILTVCSANAATFTVSKTADTNDGVCNGDCSIREAIGAANAVATNDVINFAIPDAQCPNKVCVMNLNATFGQLTVANNGGLTIQGYDWMRTIISAALTTDMRIFFNNGNPNLIINDLRINGGHIGNDQGGGFYNTGTTTFNRVLIDNNSASGFGSGIYSPVGTVNLNDSAVHSNISTNLAPNAAGIWASAGTALNVNNSSVTANYVTNQGLGFGEMGGIGNNGTLNITNSTVSENLATARTSGIGNGGVVNANNISIVGNRSINGGIAGVGNNGTYRSRNSIIAYNIIGSFEFGAIDFYNTGTLTSLTNNIIGFGGASGFTNGVNGDLVGLTTTSQINPILSPLGRYGGNSYSQVPLTTSPALEAGNNCVITLTCASNNPASAITTDQRGATRTGTIEIGAIENNPSYVAVLPRAFLNLNYNLTLVPNSGTFTYNVIAGSVPTGMSFTNAFAGFNEFSPQAAVTLSGTPTVVGTCNFTVRISDGTNTADVNYRIFVGLAVPTASQVTLAGRVTNANGRGLARVRILLTDVNGQTRYASTNPFGYYRFADVQSGETYILSAASKVYSFNEPTRVVTLNEDLTTADFTAY
jgi:CSLREA domain-containing protein